MPAAPAASTSPWPTPVRAASGGLGLAGAGLMALSWAATRHGTDFGAQMAMVVVAMGGLGVVTLAVVLWVLTGRRRIEARLATRFAAVRPSPAAAAPVEGNAEGAVPDGQRVQPVASAAMGHFHRPDCLLVTNKPVRPAPVSIHAEAGRRPCEVCRPDA